VNEKRLAGITRRELANEDVCETAIMRRNDQLALLADLAAQIAKAALSLARRHRAALRIWLLLHTRASTRSISRAVAGELVGEYPPSEEVDMSFKLAHRDDCDTAGNWKLVRRTLDLRAFGVNVVEIPAGEQIPEHDETDRDQEELSTSSAAAQRWLSTARTIRRA